jgi:RND family efflux transporter MFP subunit
MYFRLLASVLCVSLLLAGCGKKQEQQVAPVERSTRITVAVAEQRQVEVVERSVGVIESEGAPTLNAEIAGQVTRVLVDVGAVVRKGDLLAVIDPQSYQFAETGATAEARRLEVLVSQQERQVARDQQLVKENFVSTAALEEAESQLAALRAQLNAAQAQLKQARRDVAQSELRAPVNGIVDQRIVHAGDFVGRGAPMFRLVSQELIRVRLPFPETVAARLQPGLLVHLSSPLAPEQQVNGSIQQIRPALAAGRALEAIVELPNPGGWRSGASVRGAVVLASRQSVIVPETSVVERPAGQVVYLVVDNTAQEQKVETGIRRDGWIEMRQGLPAGATIAVDGAAFLTNGARVSVQTASGQQESH